MSNFNRYLRWQLRYSPLLARFMFGLITLHTGLVSPSIPNLNLGTVYDKYVSISSLMVGFGSAVMLDSFLYYLFAVKHIRFIEPVCRFANRWRHLLLLPCVYSYLIELRAVSLAYDANTHTFLAFAFYSSLLVIIGLILVLQDGVIDNERQKYENL